MQPVIMTSASSPRACTSRCTASIVSRAPITREHVASTTRMRVREGLAIIAHTSSAFARKSGYETSVIRPPRPLREAQRPQNWHPPPLPLFHFLVPSVPAPTQSSRSPLAARGSDPRSATAAPDGRCRHTAPVAARIFPSRRRSVHLAFEDRLERPADVHGTLQ